MQKRSSIILVANVAVALTLALRPVGAETPKQEQEQTKDPARTPDTPAAVVESPAPILKVPGRVGAEEQFIQSSILDLHRTTVISRLATERAQDAEVKQLAGTLMADHSAMSQDLIALAQRKGVENPLEEPKVAVGNPDAPATRRELSPFSKVPQTKVGEPAQEAPAPPKNAPADSGTKNDTVAQALMQKLQALYGDAFDTRYLQEVARHHDIATRNCEQASRYLVDEDLKKFAASALPKLQEHRQRISELADRKKIRLTSQEQASR